MMSSSNGAKLHSSLSLSLSLSPSSGLIKQFLRDVDWGDVDYLVVDTPPGTSDEHISVVQYLSGTNVDGAVLVTTPQVTPENLHKNNIVHILIAYTLCVCVCVCVV